ncbi:MAG TPA: helix-turn-helix transcriptional regulator [Longimicrobiaceae bacterium]|nr:helix-turn-helix transcriptional regulator [Longimicrobiaceae bacterium]
MDRMEQRRQIARNFASRVKALRQARGWNQVELAGKAGVHRNFINRIEKGTQIPSILIAHDMATALGVELGELLTPDLFTTRAEPTE